MYSRRSHVRIQEGATHATTGAYNVAPAPAAAKTDSNSYGGYTGTRFPNLQMIFKQRSVPIPDGEAAPKPEATGPVLLHRGSRGDAVVGRARGEAVRSEVASREAAAPGREEDVNLEADEFIKRKRKNLELQKLMSMTAAAAAPPLSGSEG